MVSYLIFQSWLIFLRSLGALYLHILSFWFERFWVQKVSLMILLHTFKFNDLPMWKCKKNQAGGLDLYIGVYLCFKHNGVGYTHTNRLRWVNLKLSCTWGRKFAKGGGMPDPMRPNGTETGITPIGWRSQFLTWFDVKKICGCSDILHQSF